MVCHQKNLKISRSRPKCDMGKRAGLSGPLDVKHMTTPCKTWSFINISKLIFYSFKVRFDVKK